MTVAGFSGLSCKASLSAHQSQRKQSLDSPGWLNINTLWISFLFGGEGSYLKSLFLSRVCIQVKSFRPNLHNDCQSKAVCCRGGEILWRRNRHHRLKSRSHTGKKNPAEIMEGNKMHHSVAWLKTRRRHVFLPLEDRCKVVKNNRIPL